MLQRLFYITNYGAFISYFVPLTYWALTIKRHRIKSMPLIIYLITNALTVFFLLYFEYKYLNAYPVFYFSVLITTSTLFFYYIKRLKLSSFFSVLIIAIMFVLFAIDSDFFQNFWQNNFLSTVFSNSILTFLAYKSIFNLLRDESILSLEKISFEFYMSSAIFILNSTSFFFSLMENEIRSSESNLFYITFPLFMLTIIFHNLLLSYGIWKLARN